MSKLPIPLKDIVVLVEYIGPTEERRHMEKMLVDGEDVTDPGHIYLNLKAVMDWLDSEGITYHDHKVL